MTNITEIYPKKTPQHLREARARNFGKWLNEAFEIMLNFSLENKFERYSTEEENQLERVLEVLTDFSDMWNKGQIMVSSKEKRDDRT